MRVKFFQIIGSLAYPKALTCSMFLPVTGRAGERVEVGDVDAPPNLLTLPIGQL